jgi:hypothetical protein
MAHHAVEAPSSRLLLTQPLSYRIEAEIRTTLLQPRSPAPSWHTESTSNKSSPRAPHSPPFVAQSPEWSPESPRCPDDISSSQSEGERNSVEEEQSEAETIDGKHSYSDAEDEASDSGVDTGLRHEDGQAVTTTDDTASARRSQETGSRKRAREDEERVDTNSKPKCRRRSEVSRGSAREREVEALQGENARLSMENEHERWEHGRLRWENQQSHMLAKRLTEENDLLRLGNVTLREENARLMAQNERLMRNFGEIRRWSTEFADTLGNMLRDERRRHD